MWWSGRHAFERKLVSQNGPEGRSYKYRYKVKERAPEDRIGVPVADSGIPREWVDAARAALKNNRRPARAGDRPWELSGEILRCAECGRSMSARTFKKPEIGRDYLYYTCVAGAAHRPDTCSSFKHHKAEDLEARVWSEVWEILKNPEGLRAGLGRMIEQERNGAHGDPMAEMEHWLGEVSEAGRKRSRYQEIAVNELTVFDELRDRLAALDETRKMAEEELRSLQHRTERLTQLECDRDTLLVNYAGFMPEALDALGSEERRQVYRMIGMEAHLSLDGSFDLSGDVINFSKVVISSS